MNRQERRRLERESHNNALKSFKEQNDRIVNAIHEHKNVHIQFQGPKLVDFTGYNKKALIPDSVSGGHFLMEDADGIFSVIVFKMKDGTYRHIMPNMPEEIAFAGDRIFESLEGMQWEYEYPEEMMNIINKIK